MHVIDSSKLSVPLEQLEKSRMELLEHWPWEFSQNLAENNYSVFSNQRIIMGTAALALIINREMYTEDKTASKTFRRS